jgi:hypothetical protein
MDARAKAALLDALSSTRTLSILVAGAFTALLLWRPLFAWAFLGFGYIGLGVRSLFRLRRLNLPLRSTRLILLGNLAAVVGVVLCSLIFALRELR